MTCPMAKKPTPWPAAGVKLQLLRSSGASLTFRIVNRRAAFDVSSPATELNPKPARILPFRCGKRGKIPKSRG
jgi:hypothetical protein